VDSITVSVVNMDDPPTVSIADPLDNSILTGLYIIKVDAVDDLDTLGTLTAEVSVDGGATWQLASYNGTSGFYEYVWDTVAAGNGAFTIDARAADSAANVGNATQVNVTIDNLATTCVTNCLRVSDIAFTIQPQGQNYRVEAAVTVVDENGAVVPEAVVDITWTRPNLSIKLDSEATDGGGISTFNVNGSAGTFKITVDALSLAGYTFDVDGSVMTSNSITVP